ncbi:MAG: hypothetical protein KKA70_14130, partial [Proteobacteria bacterium]|nr:hypothetical protein [Pseudomonadota bacterium]
MEINQIPGKFEAVRDDISLYCMRAVCDSLIHCVVKFKGHIDFKILQQAVRLSLDAEPVLGCRFIVTKFRPYWERRTDLDECDICSFHESNELDQDINKFLTLQLDPAKDSQVQVRLFRADSDVLCIKVNHMVADAGGVKEYVYLLSEIYQRLLKDPAYKPTINIDGSRSSLQVYKQFGFFKKLHIAWHTFLEWKKNTFPRGNWCMPLANGNLSERTFVIRRLSGKRFKQIREYGKKNQVTINDLIVAAFYRAFYKVIKPAHNTPLRMGATVDLRRYLSTGKGGGIANIAGFFMLNIGKEIGATFAETISLVNRQMRLK